MLQPQCPRSRFPRLPPFDVKAATDAYLATVPPDKRARSDAYFEGGYWLQLWDFLLSAAILLLLLQTRVFSAHPGLGRADLLLAWRPGLDLLRFIRAHYQP